MITLEKVSNLGFCDTDCMTTFVLWLIFAVPAKFVTILKMSGYFIIEAIFCKKIAIN